MSHQRNNLRPSVGGKSGAISRLIEHRPYPRCRLKMPRRGIHRWIPSPDPLPPLHLSIDAAFRAFSIRYQNDPGSGSQTGSNPLPEPMVADVADEKARKNARARIPVRFQSGGHERNSRWNRIERAFRIGSFRRRKHAFQSTTYATTPCWRGFQEIFDPLPGPFW